MSGHVVLFPIQSDHDQYRYRSVGDTAEQAGWNRRQAERDFLRSGCSQAVRNELAERARRARMQTNDDDHGPEAA